MCVMCDSDVEVSSMSSAKRRFVSLVLLAGWSGMPQLLLSHLRLHLRIKLSDTQLNSSELSGSPCLTPRSIAKGRLSQSVLTAAV